jgi:DNA-binding transcriptional LysR family regulator
VKVAQGESLDAITGALLSGSADLAIAADTDLPAAAGLTVEVLTAERLCVVVPPDHPLAGAAEVELGDLRDERWVLPPIERALLTRLAAQHAGFEPIIEDDAPTPALVRSLLLGGAGIGVCGPSEAGFYEPAVALALTGPEVMISIFMAYRSNYRSHGTRAVRDYMRGIFGLMDEAQAT